MEQLVDVLPQRNRIHDWQTTCAFKQGVRRERGSQRAQFGNRPTGAGDRYLLAARSAVDDLAALIT